MCKTESFKKALLGSSKIARIVPNFVYLDRIANLATATDDDLKAAKKSIERLPANNQDYQRVVAVLNNLEADLTDCQNRAAGNPPQVWKELETVRGQAANWVLGAENEAKTVEGNIARVDRKVNELRAKTNEMRRNRSETPNDRTAARLEKAIGKDEKKINDVLLTAAVDPVTALERLNEIEGEVDLLLSGTDTARNATPKGNRKASRETTKAVFDSLTAATNAGDNRLGKLLAKSDTEPDANGLTLKSQIASALSVFDDHFAKATTDQMTQAELDEVERDNTAMRVVAMVNAMALRVIKQDDVNDPLLKPLVARSIIQEYGKELAASLANPQGKRLSRDELKKQQDKAEEALKLAEAMAAEDPIMKVFTGKINGPDAVDSIRRQAKEAGVQPSKMFEMQKQQLEMRLGETTMQQIEEGKRNTDKTQSFILFDLYGELDPQAIAQLVQYQTQKKQATGDLLQKTTPEWRSDADGGGIQFTPTGQQVHRVERADETLADLAQKYYGDASKVEEIAKLNKAVVWTEQVPQPQANAKAQGKLKGKVPLVEQRKHALISDFLPNKPLPIGAVLNIAGKSSLLDQLGDYVQAWDDVKDEPLTEADQVLGDLLRDLEAYGARIDQVERQTDAKDDSGKLQPQVSPDVLKAAAKRLVPPIKPELRDLQRLTAEIKKLEADNQKLRKVNPVDADALNELETQIQARKQKLQELGGNPNDQQNTLAELDEFRTLAKTLATKLEKYQRDLQRLTGRIQKLEASEQNLLKKDPVDAEALNKLEVQIQAQKEKLEELRGNPVEASSDYERYSELRTKFQDPGYIPAPGLGQSHGLGGTLDNPPEEDPNRLRAELQKLKTSSDSLKNLALHGEVERLKQELDALTKDGDSTDKDAQLRKLQEYEQKLSELRDTPEFKRLSAAVDARRKALDEARVDEQDGALNQNQYAHIRMLARWDEEEQEQFLKEKGVSVEDYVVGRLAKLVVKDDSKKSEAKAELERAFKNISAMPLTITFRAENLFSDSTKNEPKYGSVYSSEVVHSRATSEVAKLVGRGDNVDTKAAVTGGNRTGWEVDNTQDTYKVKGDTSLRAIARDICHDEHLAARIQADNQAILDPIAEGGGSWTNLDAPLPKGIELKLPTGRGPNYLRWRTDKDDREAHQDRLPFPDQQIFGAANPNWEKTRGGDEKSTDGKVGSNYYGNAHFLLKDSVRNRIVFVVRGGQSSAGGGKTSFQRKDFLMLFYDMVRERNDTYDQAYNANFMKSLLTIGKDDFVKATNSFEFHLYGGFDIRRDAEAIYMADIVDPDVQERIKRFAAENSIRIGDKPVGLPVRHEGTVAAVEI